MLRGEAWLGRHAGGGEGEASQGGLQHSSRLWPDAESGTRSCLAALLGRSAIGGVFGAVCCPSQGTGAALFYCLHLMLFLLHALPHLHQEQR